MDEELRLSEQADRQKRIADMEAAAPVTPPIPESEHPHLPAPSPDPATNAASEITVTEDAAISPASESMPQPTPEAVDDVRTPLPIATSGELRIMPPSTGLPTPQQPPSQRSSALSGLLNAIPSAPESPAEATPTPETTAHGN
jgi:sec-independent protein translocase protein TatB